MQKALLSALFLLVFIASCKLIDDGTDSGTEPEEVTISIESPNGGESIVEGSAYVINWSSNATEKLYIAFTFDNGLTWYMIADSIANTGVYEWFPVPSTISTQCKVKITTVDQVASAISDESFSIIKNTNEAVVLISPNGNEQIEAGSQYPIRWISSEIDSIKLEYTVDNGSHWNLIDIDTYNTGIYYWEPVPDVSSTLAKIRIMDATDGNPSDESDSVFTILPQPDLSVLTPNGGETIYAGSSKTIRWSSQSIARIDIKYTTNGGANWNDIADNVDSDGEYVWANVPATYSTLCRIRIEDSEDGVPFDISNGNFVIADMTQSDQQISVLNPNGGEEVEAGTTMEINWYSANIENVSIEYTTNNGNQWNNIVSGIENTGVHYWDPVPNTPSSLTKIRIFDAEDGIPADTSDASFRILPEPQITVLKPNGGETWTVGSSQRIEWYSENIRYIKIDYTINNGADWFPVTETTASIGYYTWTEVPSYNSQLCKIRIYDADDGQPNDVSDEPFTITDPVIEETITLLEPNGGEDYEAGTLQNISWNSNSVDYVKIELSTNSGASWVELADDYENIGGYQWQINSQLNAPQSLIRVSDASDGNPNDVSDGTFKISPIKSINVTYPTSGLIFKAGDPVTVTWESSGLEKVNIRYTTTNGIGTIDEPAYYTLATDIANQGYFEIQNGFSIPSSKYFIEVFYAEDGRQWSSKSGNFKVTEQVYAEIEILFPNGGEEWLASPAGIASTNVNDYHPYEIRWNASELEKVKIEWSTTGGGSWHTVPGADSTINDGIYVWAPGQYDSPVRPDSSDNCLVRISSLSGDVYDLSDAFFSIHESKKIRIEFPNDGTERFYPPDDLADPKPSVNWPMVISWTSYAVTNVDIYYSLNNGVTWTVLSTDYPSTGAFAWDFIFGPVIELSISTQGRIKVIDSGDNRVWDSNDLPFWLNLKEGGE